jgi:hypothetical protein
MRCGKRRRGRAIFEVLTGQQAATGACRLHWDFCESYGCSVQGLPQRGFAGDG